MLGRVVGSLLLPLQAAASCIVNLTEQCCQVYQGANSLQWQLIPENTQAAAALEKEGCCCHGNHLVCFEVKTGLVVCVDRGMNMPRGAAVDLARKTLCKKHCCC
jgi:hypothetical protein